jgi:hypothetical protein
LPTDPHNHFVGPFCLQGGGGIPEPKQTTSIRLNQHGRMAVPSSSTGDFLHVAEPRARSLDARQLPKRRGRRQLLDKQNKSTCFDCEDNVTFSRKSDFERHRRLKHSHEDQQHFVCSAQGCFRGEVPWSFARSDKLTSHIKTTHNLNTIFDQCPIQYCSFGPCTLEVLGVHTRPAHWDYEAGRAVLNATSCKALRCPLWHCGKHFEAKKLLQHITSHAKEELEAADPSLQFIGLLVQSAPGYDVTIQVICPVCRTASASMEQFIRHLSTVHLCTPQSGGSEHFEKWKAYLTQNLDKYFSPGRVNKLMPWSSLDIRTLSTKRDFRCPSCQFSVAGVEKYGSDQPAKERAIIEHHLSFLCPEAEVVKELYPHRMQILRLWPEFVTHPVFADFDQLKQRSSGGPPQVQPLLPEHVNNGFGFPDWTAHPSFARHINENFGTPDWTTYDFNASM